MASGDRQLDDGQQIAEAGTAFSNIIPARTSKSLPIAFEVWFLRTGLAYLTYQFFLAGEASRFIEISGDHECRISRSSRPSSLSIHRPQPQSNCRSGCFW